MIRSNMKKLCMILLFSLSVPSLQLSGMSVKESNRRASCLYNAVQGTPKHMMYHEVINHGVCHVPEWFAPEMDHPVPDPTSPNPSPSPSPVNVPDEDDCV